eukprot:scaffold74714_cov36-Phaeocystis_antarctica.AAC.1
MVTPAEHEAGSARHETGSLPRITPSCTTPGCPRPLLPHVALNALASASRICERVAAWPHATSRSMTKRRSMLAPAQPRSTVESQSQPRGT